jgi:hypothetical protein
MEQLNVGKGTVFQVEKTVKTIGIYSQYGKARRLKSIVAIKALKDSMDRLVKKAQRILSEIQLGMIQLWVSNVVGLLFLTRIP